MYFEKPTQVKFWDNGSEGYIGGIAYHDIIICGCCGGTMSIEEVCEFAPSEITPVISLDWVPIDQEIYDPFSLN